MGLPRFELGLPRPERGRITKLSYNPLFFKRQFNFSRCFFILMGLLGIEPRSEGPKPSILSVKL